MASSAGAVALIACLLASGAASAAESKRKKGQKRGSLAVMGVVPEGNADKALLDALERTLASSLAQAGFEVLPQATVHKRLKSAPRAAAKRCAGSAECLGKLGRTAKVEQVVFGTAKAGSPGLEASLAWLAVGKETPRRAGVAFVDQATLNNSLAEVFQKLFGAPAPAALTAQPGVDLAALPLVPLEDAGSGSGGELSLELVPLAELEAPALESPGTSSAGTSQSDTRASAALTPRSTALTRRADDAPGKLSWLGYSGVGLAAVGAAVGYYAVREYRAHVDVVEELNADGALPVSERRKQVEAQAIDEGVASDHYKRAIFIGFGAAVPLVALGAGLLAWDLLDDTEVVATLAPTPQGAFGVVRVSF